VTAKYWLSLLHKDSFEIVKTCHAWQNNNLKEEGWAKKLEEELEKIGLAYCHVHVCNYTPGLYW
jgi:hypothetical protein